MAPSPQELAEGFPEDELIEAINNHPHLDSRGYSITGFPYPHDNPIVYIKHGDNLERGTDDEARSQQWAYESLQKVPLHDRQGIRIPEIYRVISLELWTIIIMEYVPGRAFLNFLEDSETPGEVLENCFNTIERALKLFLSFTVPQDTPPGPLGGGLIRHPLFRDFQSTIEYSSVDLLEMHLNKLATWFNQSATTLNLERELHFVFGDLYEGNFIFADSGDLYIIDFEQANFLPLSFMTYAMIQHHDVCSLRDRFDLPQENLEIMRRVCSLLIMSNRKLGLPVG